MQAAILGLIRYRIGIDPHRVEGIDLLRDAKDPDLCSHAGAGPGRDHDGGQDRPHFPDKGEGNGRPESPYRAKLYQGVEKLQSEHHTGEKAHQHHDQGRCGADIEYLVYDLAELLSPEDIDKGQEKKMAIAPKLPSRRRVPRPMSVSTVIRGFELRIRSREVIM